MGHVLGNPIRRDNPDALDTKNMSPVPFGLVRTLTHMAMLLGAFNDTQVLYTTSDDSQCLIHRPVQSGHW